MTAPSRYHLADHYPGDPMKLTAILAILSTLAACTDDPPARRDSSPGAELAADGGTLDGSGDLADATPDAAPPCVSFPETFGPARLTGYHFGDSRLCGEWVDPVSACFVVACKVECEDWVVADSTCPTVPVTP